MFFWGAQMTADGELKLMPEQTERESVLNSHAPLSNLCSQGPVSPVTVTMPSNPCLHI